MLSATIDDSIHYIYHTRFEDTIQHNSQFSWVGTDALARLPPGLFELDFVKLFVIKKPYALLRNLTPLVSWRLLQHHLYYGVIPILGPSYECPTIIDFILLCDPMHQGADCCYTIGLTRCVVPRLSCTIASPPHSEIAHQHHHPSELTIFLNRAHLASGHRSIDKYHTGEVRRLQHLKRFAITLQPAGGEHTAAEPQHLPPVLTLLSRLLTTCCPHIGPCFEPEALGPASLSRWG